MPHILKRLTHLLVKLTYAHICSKFKWKKKKSEVGRERHKLF